MARKIKLIVVCFMMALNVVHALADQVASEQVGVILKIKAGKNVGQVNSGASDIAFSNDHKCLWATSSNSDKIVVYDPISMKEISSYEMPQELKEQKFLKVAALDEIDGIAIVKFYDDSKDVRNVKQLKLCSCNMKTQELKDICTIQRDKFLAVHQLIYMKFDDGSKQILVSYREYGFKVLIRPSGEVTTQTCSLTFTKGKDYKQTFNPEIFPSGPCLILTYTITDTGELNLFLLNKSESYAVSYAPGLKKLEVDKESVVEFPYDSLYFNYSPNIETFTVAGPPNSDNCYFYYLKYSDVTQIFKLRAKPYDGKVEEEIPDYKLNLESCVVKKIVGDPNDGNVVYVALAPNKMTLRLKSGESVDFGAGYFKKDTIGLIISCSPVPVGTAIEEGRTVEKEYEEATDEGKIKLKDEIIRKYLKFAKTHGLTYAWCFASGVNDASQESEKKFEWKGTQDTSGSHMMEVKLQPNEKVDLFAKNIRGFDLKTFKERFDSDTYEMIEKSKDLGKACVNGREYSPWDMYYHILETAGYPYAWGFAIGVNEEVYGNNRFKTKMQWFVSAYNWGFQDGCDYLVPSFQDYVAKKVHENYDNGDSQRGIPAKSIEYKNGVKDGSKNTLIL